MKKLKNPLYYFPSSFIDNKKIKRERLLKEVADFLYIAGAVLWFFIAVVIVSWIIFS